MEKTSSYATSAKKILLYLLLTVCFSYGSPSFAQGEELEFAFENVDFDELVFNLIIESGRENLQLEEGLTLKEVDSYLSNCPVDGTTLRGQALYVKGGTGFGKSPEVNRPVNPKDIEFSREWFSDISVIIADLGDNTNLNTHGGLVYSHTQALVPHWSTIRYVDVSGTTQDTANQIRAEVGEFSGRVVVNMSFSILPCGFLDDVQGRTYEEYKEAIFSKAENVAALNNFRNIILNTNVDRKNQVIEMILNSELRERNDKFGDFVRTFVQSSDPNLDDAVESAINRIDQNNFSEESALVRLLLTFPHIEQGDPLLQMIRKFDSEGRFGATPIFVAAAGNQSFLVPLYPAEWPEVLAVSSSLTTDFSMSRSSNGGQVMAPGSSFRTQDSPDNCSGNDFRANGRAECVAYEGTSFAAPAVSLFIASQFNNQNCIDNLFNLGKASNRSLFEVCN